MALSDEPSLLYSADTVNEPDSLFDDVLQKSVERENRVSYLPNVMLGKIVAIGDAGPSLILPMISSEPITAMSVCRVTEKEIGQTCVVQFIDNDVNKAIVMGLLVEQQATILPDSPSTEPVSELVISQRQGSVKIEAQDELVLQCGESRIIMNANGVIRIRGLYIDSQARATQRIRGGSVRVN